MYLYFLYCSFYTSATFTVVSIFVLLILLLLCSVDLYSTPATQLYSICINIYTAWCYIIYCWLIQCAYTQLYIYIYIHSSMLYYLAYKGRTVTANLFSPVLLLMCFPCCFSFLLAMCLFCNVALVSSCQFLQQWWVSCEFLQQKLVSFSVRVLATVMSKFRYSKILSL